MPHNTRQAFCSPARMSGANAEPGSGGALGWRPSTPRSAACRAGHARPSAPAGAPAERSPARAALVTSAAPASHARRCWLLVAWLAAPALLGSDLAVAGRGRGSGGGSPSVPATPAGGCAEATAFHAASSQLCALTVI
jgi:hypothetical protein